MNIKSLRPKKALRAALFVLLLGVVGTTKMYASFDFSAVCETGQTLYYNITDAENHYVELTYPGSNSGSWTGFTKPMGDIILPESVQYDGVTYSVTSIGYWAFSSCSSLTTIEISNSVTSIGSGAFYGCSGLTTIEIPNSVTSIGSFAFQSCTSLTSIEIPNSVTSIGGNVFSFCSGLEQIIVDSENTDYDSRDNCNAIINTSTNALVTGCKNTVIPNSVTSIGSSAFSGCSSLTSIEIPNSVTSINGSAFRTCSSLTTIEIPNSVTSIGNSVFEGCSGLTSIEIPNSVTSIPSSAFRTCSGLTSIEIPNLVTSIGSYAFYGCSGLTSIEIPNLVTSIGSYAFYGCSGLTSIEIPNSVTSIGDWMFYDCTSLTSIEIPNSVTSIGNSVFEGCSGLTTIEIPNSVTSIGISAFNSCSGLTSIEISDSVTSIGSSAFSSCSGLTLITILAENPPTLGNYVFSGVSRFIPVYVPCGCVEAYTTTNWGGFNNFVGLCAGEITVTANPAEGGTVTGEGYYEGGATCTLTATANPGYYFVNWSENGTVISYDASYSFLVSGNRDLVANFAEGNMIMIVIGDEGPAINNDLPSNNLFSYSLTQQIYTADEIGIAGTINSMAFYNGGAENTRTYDFYLVATDKTSFDGKTDWVSVSDADKVFSGGVTMVADGWTMIVFDTPFEYDGTSNIILVADDNTGSYTIPNMACRVFSAQGNQAIRISSDGTNFSLINPSYYYNGILMDVKNQIMFGIIPSTTQQTINLAQGWNWFSTNVEITLDDLKTALVEALPGTTINIKSQTQNTKYQNGRWTGQLTALDMTQMYMISVENDCEISLEGMPIDPSGLTVTINYGANWIAFPYSEDMSVTDFFGSFPVNNDQVKSQSQNARYQGNRWAGQLNTLVPGKGYMYISNTSESRTFTFPTSAK